ncbi:hypothetical protein MD484_g4781, partial [Candolleomyces efflorescens]
MTAFRRRLSSFALVLVKLHDRTFGVPGNFPFRELLHSRALKSHAPFSRGSAPLTPPQYEKRSGSTNVNTSQHSKLWTEFASSGLSTPETPARKGAGISQGKKKEREIKSLPSPPPSDSASRIRRIAQQPGSSRTPAGASANPPTFGPARPPAKANRQSSPETFLPIPIVGIPGLSYTLDEFDTVYNRKTGGRQYKLLNGELLKEYQTIDVDREMAASMYRHCLRVEKGRGRPVARDPDELVQGVLLNYETGLGKTHVASVLIDRGRVHRKKINESLGVPDLPLKQDLIIAPLSTHNHWEEHLTRLSEGRLTVKIWVPSSRGAFDPEVDVYIITIESFRNHHHRFGTYQDMIDERHELNPAENPKRDWSLGLTEDDMAWVMSKAPFAVTEFNTIVVDESHDARNSASLGARALLSARADSFLLLTGTPAQNTLDDLQINFSLMVHRSKRHDFREAEKQNRKLNKDRKMKGEKARSLPMHADEVLGTRFNGTKEIEHFMNNCMVTRRSRCPEQGTALVELPKLHRVRVEVLQNIQEKELGHYVAALTDCDGPLVRILRERQVVLHGNLVRKVTCPRVVDEAMMDEDVTDNLQVISYNVLPSDLKFLKIDSDDIQEAIETSLKRELPSELKGMGLDQLLEPKYIPSKFKAVYAIIEKVPEGEKVLIFSNFTSLLDLLAEFLEDNDIGNIQFDGRMNSRERETALRTIANDIDVKVMLVSMKAGGVGLNITACNHIILFDSWWNPYVESDKASVEITSPFDGIVKELLVPEGDIAKVGSGLCVIEVEAEADSAEDNSASSQGSTVEFTIPKQEASEFEAPSELDPPKRGMHPLDPKNAGPKLLHELRIGTPPTMGKGKGLGRTSSLLNSLQEGSNAQNEASGSNVDLSFGTTNAASVLAPPSIRHLAKLNNVDLAQIAPGSGKDGRIEQADVEAFLKGRERAGAPASVQPQKGGERIVEGEDVVVELGRTRYNMWKAMVKSLEIPHFGYSTTLDITELHNMLPLLNTNIPEQYLPPSIAAQRQPAAIRMGMVNPNAIYPATDESLLPESQQYTKLTYLPVLLKTLSKAMMQWPLLRSSITPSSATAANSKPTLTVRPQADIAIALSTPTGLYTPTLTSVNSHSIYSLASSLKHLSHLGRQTPVSGLTPKEMPKKGGTITVSNVGAVGQGESASPVLVPGGGVAIVALGRAKWVWDVDRKPEGERRLKIGISWSADHRVVEGAELAAFVECWRGYVEEPARLVGEGV